MKQRGLYCKEVGGICLETRNTQRRLWRYIFSGIEKEEFNAQLRLEEYKDRWYFFVRSRYQYFIYFYHLICKPKACDAYDIKLFIFSPLFAIATTCGILQENI